MSKIIAVADTHGDRAAIQIIRDAHPDAFLRIHCGDSELRKSDMLGYITVQGNADYPDEFPGGKLIRTSGHTILVKHGHDLFGSYPQYRYLAEEAKKYGCDILLFGHAHVFCDETVNGVRIINPGAVTNAKDGIRSYAELLIENDNVVVHRILYPQNCRM